MPPTGLAYAIGKARFMRSVMKILGRFLLGIYIKQLLLWVIISHKLGVVLLMESWICPWRVKDPKLQWLSFLFQSNASLKGFMLQLQWESQMCKFMLLLGTDDEEPPTKSDTVIGKYGYPQQPWQHTYVTPSCNSSFMNRFKAWSTGETDFGAIDG